MSYGRQHDWATIGHTADNANWQGLVLHFDEMAEFLGSQFGVFGPIFFAVLLLAIPRSRAMAKVLPEQARLLLAFSLPILLIVTGQALLSRANANWAATAYPAATILIASVLLESARRRIWLVGSLGLHLAVALVVYVAIQFPGPVARALGKDPFRDVLGWDAVAGDVSAAMDAADTAVLLMDNRLMMASMAYALRDRPDLVIRSWNHDTKIDHHYEMAWLYDPGRDGGRVLLLTHHGTEGIAADFDAVEMLPDITRTDQTGRERRIEMRLLERLK